MCTAKYGCMPSCSTVCARGVLIAESVWPNAAYEDGRGINTLTGADAIAPYGGAAFHDNKVWIPAPCGDRRCAACLLRGCRVTIFLSMIAGKRRVGVRQP